MKDIFVMTDLHGQYKLFKTMINWCYEQNPECTIVYLGDAADRGPDGYKIMKELLKDSHIIYLYGNHEDLFVKAASAITAHYTDNDFLLNCDEIRASQILDYMFAQEDVNLHIWNGGKPTLTSWLLDGANNEIINQLRALPRTYSYENIDFCHAGGEYQTFEDVAQKECLKEAIPNYLEEIIIWDRDALPLGWKTGRICVHGHTPTIYLPGSIYGGDRSKAKMHPCIWQDRMGAKNKRGGWKIDIDTGATFTGRAYILNALTFEITGFFDPFVIGDTGDIEKIEQYKLNI